MKRNVTLDIFKLVLALMVICIHIPNLFSEGSVISWYFSSGIVEMAVPTFFVISGFLLGNKLDNPTIFKKHLIHLVIVYLVWSFFYLHTYWFIPYRKVKLEMFITGYYHLWYISNLILGLLVLFLFRLKIKSDFVFCCIVLISFFFLNISENGYAVKFSTAFLFLAMGQLIYRKVDYSKLNLSFLLVASLVCLIVLPIILYPGVIDKPFRVWLVAFMLLATSVSFFLLVMRLPISRDNRGFYRFLGSFSGAVYFIHLYVVTWYVEPEWNIFNMPIVLFKISILATVIVFLNRKLKFLL